MGYNVTLSMLKENMVSRMLRKGGVSAMRTVATPACTLITGRTLLVLIAIVWVWVTDVPAHPPNHPIHTWHTDGPAGEIVYSIAAEPSSTASNHVYAGTTNGVYKADTATLNWVAASNGLPTNAADGTLLTVLSLAVDPQLPLLGSPIIYAGTNQLGTATTLLFRSTDGGATWAPTGLPAPSGIGGVFGLVIDPTPVADPQTQRTLYVATFGGAGIYKSTDSGSTFSANTANNGLGNEFVIALGLHVTPPNVHVLYASTSFAGVYKSTDGGASWTAVNTGLPTTPGGFSIIESLAIEPTNPNIVYAGTGGGVYRTSDGGVTWNAANTGLTDLQVISVVIDPATFSTIYAGTIAQDQSGGVFKSTNGGNTWSPLNDGLTNKHVHSLAADPANPGRLYVGTSDDGVFAIQQSSAPAWTTLPAISTTGKPVRSAVSGRTRPFRVSTISP